MPSVQRYDLYCARHNGQWASEIRVDLDPNDGHKTGWDSSQTSGTSMYYPNETEWNGGYAGNRKIWDNDEAMFYASQGPQFGSLAGVYDAGTYTFDRSWGDDGTAYFIRHSGWANRNGQALGLPLPTYTLSMSGNTGWGNRSGSMVTNRDLSPYTHTYESWSNNITKDPIVIYSRPYIPDQTMTITSLTTPHQYTPGNLTGSVLLKQPSIYASIDLTSSDIGAVPSPNEAAMGYSAGQTIWNDDIWMTQKFVKILAYTPQWDSINDIEFAWSVTGAGAGGFNQTAGVINNFQPVTASGWADYAYGYQAIDIALTTIYEKSTDVNIVANGLKFASGIQSRNYNIR